MLVLDRRDLRHLRRAGGLLGRRCAPRDRDDDRGTRAQLRGRRVAPERLGRDVREAEPVASIARDRCLRRVRLRGRSARRRGRARRGTGVGIARRRTATFLHRAADAIEARAERIARDMTAEMGKPLRESRLEAARAATILRYAAGEAWRPVGELYEPSVPDQRLYTLRRPVGVVGLITPWNFPIAIPVWKLAPALAYGNVVVLKLAYEAPRTGIHVAECFAEAGLPPGVLNVLTGAGSTAGAELVRNPLVRAISFTGSVPVGHAVRGGDGPRLPCSARARPQPARRGGNAELERAPCRVRGGVLVRGQKRTATRRIFVLDDVYDEFRDRLLARVEAGCVGDPADPDVEVGPIGHRARDGRDPRRDRPGTGRGRRAPGRRWARRRRGLPDRPNHLRGGSETRRSSRARRSSGRRQALPRQYARRGDRAGANAVPFGLSASLFTRDLAAVQRSPA